MVTKLILLICIRFYFVPEPSTFHRNYKMPAKNITNYRRPGFLFNGHLETIYPALFRKINDLPTHKKIRLDTPDSDFLDVDWYCNNNKQLLILQHGLEGDSKRPYMLGMTKAFYKSGYDICSWNFRGCGKEMNKQPYFYHSGASHDLEIVVNHFSNIYDDITLIGFSLGGNMTLKYLGEKPRPHQVKRSVVFSVPLDLDAGADNLSTRKCFIYERRFLKHLKSKIRRKATLMSGKIDTTQIPKVKTIRDFDEYFTAPMNGFKGAADYYKKCSSKYFLDGIRVPTLIVNALNDPILTPECLDHCLTQDLHQVFLETTSVGGHVGFAQFEKEGLYWSEKRALKFCKEYE